MRSANDTPTRILRDQHENILEVADQMIDEPACHTLCAAYDGVCRYTFEGRTMAELEAILQRLLEKYPQA